MKIMPSQDVIVAFAYLNANTVRERGRERNSIHNILSRTLQENCIMHNKMVVFKPLLPKSQTAAQPGNICASHVVPLKQDHERTV